MPLTKWVLRDSFTEARKTAALKAEAAKKPAFAAEIHGDQAATNLLGHGSAKTTKDHYLRRDKIVAPSR